MEHLTYLNYIAWGAVGLQMALSAYHTFIGVVQLKRLKLRSRLFLSLEFWFISISYALLLLNHYGPVLWISLLLGLGFAIITAAVFMRERERESSIGQLLKSLPLRDRLLGRYPKDLLERPLPPPVPPRLPDRAMTALILLIVNGVMVLALGFFLSLLFQLLLLPVLPNLGAASSWFPLIMAAIFSGFLFAGSVLIWKKRYVAGGVLGIIFGAITLGFMLIGACGIIGGVLALTSKESRQFPST